MEKQKSGKTPEYIYREFKIELPDPANENQFIEETYAYCFNDLSVARVWQALKFFELDIETTSTPPKEYSEIVTLAHRQIKNYAISAILMKITGKALKGDDSFNIYEDYDVYNMDKTNILDKIRGADNIIKLRECIEDFFYHTGLSEKQLALQSGNIISELSKVSAESPGLISELLKAASQLGDTNLSTR